MQLGNIQGNTVNIIYDPTHGLIGDVLEVGWNYALGKTVLASGNIKELNTYSQNISEAANQYDITGMRMVGHSGGGDRLYMGVLYGANQLTLSKIDPVTGVAKELKYGAFSEAIPDSNAKDGYRFEPRLSVQFYGTPSFTQNIGTAATYAGAWMNHTGSVELGTANYTNGHIINSGDFVGNILGQNAFRGYDKSAVETGKSIISAPKLFGDSSPHSNYYCVGTFCGFNNLNINSQNRSQTP